MVKQACRWSQFAWKCWVTFIELIEVILQWDIVQSTLTWESVQQVYTKQSTFGEDTCCIQGGDSWLMSWFGYNYTESSCCIHVLGREFSNAPFLGIWWLASHAYLSQVILHEEAIIACTYCWVLCYQEPVIYFIITSLSMILWYSCAHKRFECFTLVNWGIGLKIGSKWFSRT